MTNAKVSLEESDIIRLILQFFNGGKLHKSMRNLEKESGVTNCELTDDVLFLRQLILDGEWEAILTFAQPLENTEGFDVRKFRYLVLRQKFMEVLYFKSGIDGVSNTSYSIEDLIKCLNQLEKDCPFKSDYTKLCWLLTVPDLSEQPEYQNWNPETARLQCFEEVLELLRSVMPVKKKNGKHFLAPSKDRLENLIIKGLCFESCIDYCQQRAISGDGDDDSYFMVKGSIMSGSSQESTGNFISWLRNLPQESFVAPFEPMDLDMEYKKLERVKTFQLSNKKLKNEAESLSRSLTMKNRPSTADQVFHLTSQANGHEGFSSGIRAQSALTGMTKVSNSYNEFHYNPKNSHFKPIKKVESDMKNVDDLNDIELNAITSSSHLKSSEQPPTTQTGDRSRQGPVPQEESQLETACKNQTGSEMVSANDQTTDELVSDKKPVSVTAVRDSVQLAKGEQERNVLRQLQEHEKQKLELQRQLMEIKSGPIDDRGLENNGLCNTNNVEQHHQRDFVKNEKNLNNEQIYTSVSRETNMNGNLESPDNTEGVQTQKHESVNTALAHDNRPSPEGLENENVYTETTPGEEPSLEFDDGNFPAANPNYFAVTSTPVSKRKPKPLVLNDQSSVLPAPDESVMPDNENVMKTPMAKALPPGHWVALADGSGVLNTSTPKASGRNKVTPAPLASPVLASKEDIPDGTPVSRKSGSSNNPQPKNEQNMGTTKQEQPLRKGPKINGVRRNIAANPRLMGKPKNPSLANEQQDTKPTRPAKTSQNPPRAKTSSPVTKTGSGTSTPRSGASSPSSPRGRAGSPKAGGARINSPRGRADSPSNSRGRTRSPSGSRGRTGSPSGSRGRAISPTSGTTKGRASNPSSPRAQITAHQKQAAAKRQAENTSVPQNTSASTFVVEKAGATIGNDLKPLVLNSISGPTSQPSQDNINEDKPVPNVINATYQKQPRGDAPMSNGTQNQEDHSTVMQRQQDFLSTSSEPIRFVSIATLEDLQAVRAVAFHPGGQMFAIGANSKILRVCAATGISSYSRDQSSQTPSPPTILFKRNRHHRGSIYCLAWNNSGDLIATGSNDKSIKVLHFDPDNYTQVGPELELNIHNGTVRDLAFVSRTSGSAVLVSGGAGNGHIQISDCTTGNTIGQLRGHSGHIMSVFAAKDDIIASGSSDNTVRLWDLRSQRCIDAIATGDSCVASVCVNPTGALLASGHEDGGCMIYDITAGRTLQFFKPHTSDCRSVRFSPDGHYLMSGSYDTSIILQDMQQSLECSIPPYSVVAQHDDKVIQCRWHPSLMAFVSSSADKTARLWTLDC